jgi:hypothetical protein
MPNPYKARVDVRRFLNLSGFTAARTSSPTSRTTSGREITKRDLFGYEASLVRQPPGLQEAPWA